MTNIDDDSIDLIVSSPPYPMIEMWDNLFTKFNSNVGKSIDDFKGDVAFELMHKELDKTWAESFRILKKGGFACINIGDATRSIGKRFQIYSNHSRIIQAFKKLGFDTLPVIIWRKQTNAPNKYMGSGMLPAGAYVTLEHEYILVFRKSNKRIFKKDEDKLLRQKSSFFWEERNKWFSDVWFDLKGVAQNSNNKELRKRSGAYPFELAYRLINMYSVRGDMVLDPFLGTGTTTFASIASCRNSIGFEIDNAYKEHIINNSIDSLQYLNNRISNRFSEHLEFVNDRISTKGPLKYKSKNYNFPVMTRQEIEMELPYVESIRKKSENEISVIHSDKSEIRNLERIPTNVKKPQEHPDQIKLNL